MISIFGNGVEEVVAWSWVLCLTNSSSCTACSKGNEFLTWAFLSPSISIIFLDLNWSSLHFLSSVSSSWALFVWTDWTNLLLGFGLGWAGSYSLKLVWGFCCNVYSAGSVAWGRGIVPTRWFIDLCQFDSARQRVNIVLDMHYFAKMVDSKGSLGNLFDLFDLAMLM